MHGFLFLRRIPNSAPQPSGKIRQLPNAVGLERNSHGAIQSIMLINFHTFRHEKNTRTGKLPIKRFHTHLQQINQKTYQQF
jgi:hypothetical protein